MQGSSNRGSQIVGREAGNPVTRSTQILLLFVLTVVFSSAAPSPVPADDMVLFKNGRTLRADELILKDGTYLITTMSGGIMKVPLQLVERVISCVVDKEVEESRGSDPAGSRPPGNTKSSKSKVTRIPPVGAGGGGGRVRLPPLGGGKTGKATSIPPRGGRSPGNTGSRLTKPGEGKEGKK